MRLRLSVWVSHGTGAVYPVVIEHLPARLGRAADADVRLPDEAISLYHAELRHEDGAFCLADLGSTNGTAVNSERVRGLTRLVDGDEISMGPFRLSVRVLTGRTVGAAEPLAIGTTSLRLAAELRAGSGSALALATTAGGPICLIEPADGRVITVGRSRRCDVRIDGQQVSRHHARMGHDRGEGWIEDLASRHGTLVNGERIAGRTTLVKGDRVRLGDAELIVVDGDEAHLERTGACVSDRKIVRDRGGRLAAGLGVAGLAVALTALLWLWM